MTFKQLQWVAVFLGIASIEAALLYKLIAGQGGTSATEIIVAICIVGTLLVLSPNLDSLKELSLGKEGFSVQLEVLQKKISENEQAIVNLILRRPNRHFAGDQLLGSECRCYLFDARWPCIFNG
jgi:hypothetical protein